MNVVTCFWMTPIARVRRSLRRFVFNSSTETSCPSYTGYHNAVAQLDEVDCPVEQTIHIGDGTPDVIGSDSRWPVKCSCGYAFARRDPRQLFVERIYQCVNGDRFTLNEAPAGAMYDADHLREICAGSDGIALMVKLPNGGWWLVDDTTGEARWSRTGVVPCITAAPSIRTPTYHGHLIDGELREC